MPGRLATPPGFQPADRKGLGTREARRYLLLSLACQPNPDQARAARLLEHDLRLAIVAEALSWTGTPYADHARIKGVACDCAQLPAAVFEAVGIIPHVQPDYSPQWMMHHDEELYLAEIRRFARDIPVEDVKPGDLVVWKFGRTYSHSAIVIDPPMVIHAAVRGGFVFQMNMDQDEDYRPGSRHPRLAFSVFNPDGSLYRPADA